MQRLTRAKLVGTEIQQEVCLLRVGEDGSLYLAHIEAEVMDEATGERRGTLLFNGEISLPVGRFELRPA